ncbi:hypothetical protein QFC20_005549 [Naganishia adeliensis]|uniref:Uncharacterized protein n=1 Tax=Naganishia adeliensis TaxID=92952 RepID=A0ACC2VMK1_9TREE|nr:hypothetical protein QFC20_005549 [Naganishia adeliensis]
MVTQISKTEAQTPGAREGSRIELESTKVGDAADPAKQSRTVGGGGVIDLDKLMHTIDMTRKVAMLQQRLNQASLLAQRQSSAAVTEQASRPARSTTPTTETEEAATSSSTSNLRKRKSMASLSIVAPREIERFFIHISAQQRRSPGPGTTPRSPSFTALRSPSSSAAAGIHVLNNIASRRRESGAGVESPRNASGGAHQTIGAGPRVAFAYPRSPAGSSVQTVRSPSRGRYISSSSGYPRFETSGFSEFGIGARDKTVESSKDEMDVDSDPAQSPRKRLKNAQQSSLSRRPSGQLMPAFGSNTIYGIHQRPDHATGETQDAATHGSSSKKPRSASHSVDSRPFVARNILKGYQHVETPRTEPKETPFAPASNTTPGTRMNMPLGTDASDVDAANGLMSMLGSAPATFNPSRNVGPPRVKSPPSFEGSGIPSGAQLRAPKPRAASFAAILTSNRGLAGPAQRLASPTRVRRLQHDKHRASASPSSTRRQGGKPLGPFTSDENVSAFATSSSSDEEKYKASASASDEDQQAAEAILFLAASPSPAIAHSSPHKAVAGRKSSTDVKIGRVLFDDTPEEADPSRPTHSLKGYSALPLSMLSQKRGAVGESPLQQPPFNNTSPSSDRFSRTRPAPLPLLRTKHTESDATRDEGRVILALPLTASTDSATDETERPVQLPEPSQLLSPPTSDTSKP